MTLKLACSLLHNLESVERLRHLEWAVSEDEQVSGGDQLVGVERMGLPDGHDNDQCRGIAAVRVDVGRRRWFVVLFPKKLICGHVSKLFFRSFRFAEDHGRCPTNRFCDIQQ